MSVSAMEANLLHRMLLNRAAEPDPLAGLAEAFLIEAQTLIESPWTSAAILTSSTRKPEDNVLPISTKRSASHAP
jgi:hypothetical protein